MTTALLKELGLEHSILAANEGNLPEENFLKILDIFKDSSISDDVKNG